MLPHRQRLQRRRGCPAFGPTARLPRFVEKRPTPQDLVERMGLHRGEVYYDGLKCGLDRQPLPHRLDGRRRGNICASAAAAHGKCSPDTTTALELQTLNALLRSADYRGSDVRLDTGDLYKPASWPRRFIEETVRHQRVPTPLSGVDAPPRPTGRFIQVSGVQPDVAASVICRAQ